MLKTFNRNYCEMQYPFSLFLKLSTKCNLILHQELNPCYNLLHDAIYSDAGGHSRREVIQDDGIEVPCM